jgi:hypothetical protein
MLNSSNLSVGISPKTGYKSESKQSYRNAVWADLSGYVKPNTWAVMMPARGCEEIEAALSAGVPAENIFCFDSSSAVIATSHWRKKYPDIKFATSSLAALPAKIKKTGKLVSAINMDLCGNVSGAASDEIHDFLSSGVMTDDCAFSVNLAKGREGRQLLATLKMVGSPKWFDCDRMAAMYFLTEGFAAGLSCIGGISQGTYRENKTPMTWATMFRSARYEPHRDQSHIDSVRRMISENDYAGFAKSAAQVFDLQRSMARDCLNIDAESENTAYACSMSRAADPGYDFLKGLRGLSL